MARHDDETKPGGDASSGAGQSGASGASKARPSESKSAAGAATQNKAAAGDAIALLKQDHRAVEALFKEFETADAGRRSQIIETACQELAIHSLLEERVFYPAARRSSTEDKLDMAQVEHDAAKVLIVELIEDRGGDRYRDAKFKVLAEAMRRHIKEEEAADGVMAKAQSAGVNTRELAERLTALKQELKQRAEAGRLPYPQTASLQLFGDPSRQERAMPRERDEYGRFMDEDDRGYRSRGRDYDRDERGRFASDDDDRGGRRESRSFSGRGRAYEDDDRSRDRGQGGWFGDREGHSEAARRGWDDPRHGPSGWYGDPEGHSEASRRGWDNPRHGPSGWYGDREGHSEASRRGWDNPRHGPSGWYGDPEGHSEASRRGWEERGGGRYSRARGRDYDDDYDDDRRSSRGGRGGWSGDPEGHSEAARRGWQNRR